jgi:hypothetical protein
MTFSAAGEPENVWADFVPWFREGADARKLLHIAVRPSTQRRNSHEAAKQPTESAYAQTCREETDRR